MTHATIDAGAPAATGPSPNAFAYPAFVKVWRGQTISVFGSQMTAFAMSIWIYQQTGSVLQFGAVLAAQMVPAILFSQLAGVLIDRYQRKIVMLTCDLALIAALLVMCLITYQGQLTPTTVLMMSPVLALFGSVHQIAYSSSISQLVPREAYGKANGFIQLGINGSAAIVPLISVYALDNLGLLAMFALTIGTYSVAAISLLFAQFIELPASANAKAGAAKATVREAVRSIMAEQTFGMRFIFSNRSLLALMLFLAGVSFFNGVVMVLFRPMVLGTSNSTVLGWLAMIGGIGGLAGAILTALVARADKARTLLVSALVAGACTMLCGASTHFGIMAITVFAFSFASPFTVVAAQTLMQNITPSEAHGRVFGARAFFSSLALITAVGAAPVATEYLFMPLLAEGAVFEELGYWLDAGTSGGMRVAFILAGACMVVLSVLFMRGRRFRMLNEQAAPAQPLEAGAVGQ